jgi:hypothetical protein
MLTCDIGVVSLTLEPCNLNRDTNTMYSLCTILKDNVRGEIPQVNSLRLSKFIRKGTVYMVLKLYQVYIKYNSLKLQIFDYLTLKKES